MPMRKDLQKLTRRELQIAVEVAKGKSNRQIASELGLSIYTVRDTIGRIMSRLEARNRAAIGWLLFLTDNIEISKINKWNLP